MKRLRSQTRLWGLTALALAVLPLDGRRADAQTPPPTPSLVDPDLAERTVATGLTTPIHLAFLGRHDMLVLEKNTGKVQRLVNGVLSATVLDLAVNSASERGLLSIALHPRFKQNGFVYLFWTESTTGADSAVLADVPLLGNRVDRFRLERLDAHLGPEPDPPARLPGRCRQPAARQPQRRRDRVRPGKARRRRR